MDRNTPTATVEPQNFEMREVGNILQCVPEISHFGNNINILLNPEHHNKPIWKNYSLPQSAKKTNSSQPPMEVPFIHRYSISTQVTVNNGSTLLIGGGMNNEDGNKTVYAFITAKNVDMKGNFLPSPDLNTKHQATNNANFETHYIYVNPPSGCFTVSCSELNEDGTVEEDIRSEWKLFSKEQDVEWPQGSDIKYIPNISHIKITNTLQKIEKFRNILFQYNALPRLIETRIDFVEFKISRPL